MKTLLIYRLGSLGDSIVALPFFNRIAERFPDYRRVVLTNMQVESKAAPLHSVVGSALIHDAIAYPIGVRSPRALWDMRRRLRELNTQEMVYLMPTRGMISTYRDVAFFRLCGFTRLIGVPWIRDLDVCRISSKTGEEEPECERLARTMSELGSFNLRDPSLWNLHLNAAETAAGMDVVAPLASQAFIAINMGGKAAQKDWGIENWRQLLTRISRHEPQLGLLVIGAAEDSIRVRQVSDGWQGTLIDACGKISPRQSAAAMRGARLFIGHDSGPLHLASAVGIRCVGLFGDFNRPRKWHPYLGDNRILHDFRGVTAITVDEVFSTVAAVL